MNALLSKTLRSKQSPDFMSPGFSSISLRIGTFNICKSAAAPTIFMEADIILKDARYGPMCLDYPPTFAGAKSIVALDELDKALHGTGFQQWCGRPILPDGLSYGDINTLVQGILFHEPINQNSEFTNEQSRWLGAIVLAWERLNNAAKHAIDRATDDLCAKVARTFESKYGPN